MATRASIVVVGLIGAIAACRDAPTRSANVPRSGTLAAALSLSASRAGVPRDLLVAIAHVEDGLTLPRTRTAVRLDEHVPAAGPLQLRRGKLDTLRRGAELVGASEIDLRRDGNLALEAGARVLAELGASSGVMGGASTGNLASWNAALEEMSGFADDAHRRHWAHQVFAVLARGGSFPSRDGEVTELSPHDLPPSLTLDLSTTLHVLDVSEYQGAEWIPTSCKNKCYPTRNGNPIEYVVIHDTEGNWNASVATLQNDAEKSVQYIVGTDGHVAQFVTEATTAWHAGNLSFNYRSVGIEHVGYAVQPFTEAQYAASAKLVDYLASKYAIPRDRSHVIGHDQVPNGSKIPATSAPCADSPAACEASDDWGGANNHRDPGIWEWATYMPRFSGQAKCDDVSELWRCSADNTKRVRCASSSSSSLVTIEGCVGSCSAGPSATTNGNEAACTTTPATEPPPIAPKTPGEPGPNEEASPPPADSGCSVAPSASAATASPLLLFVALAGALARRKRALDGSDRVVRFLVGSDVDGSHSLFRRDRRRQRS